MIKEIFERRSVREFSGEDISEENIKLLLKSGFAAPSAHKKAPRVFYVIKNKEVLNSFYEKHPFGKSFKTANMAILVCGDKNIDDNITFLIQDCSASIQNICLMATSLNIGSVWCGILDNSNATQITKEILDIPDNLVPISIVSLGYTDIKKPQNDYYDENAIERIY